MLAKKYIVNMIEHARRFTNAWDYSCVAFDAYLQGYRFAKENADSEEDTIFPEGNTQLNTTNFRRWQAENRNFNFQESMETYMIHWNIDNLMVHTDKNGKVSFQGTAVKK